MKIRKAMKLAWEGSKVRRQAWDSGLYCVMYNMDVVFWNEVGDPEEDCYLDVNDILADDWEVVE